MIANLVASLLNDGVIWFGGIDVSLSHSYLEECRKHYFIIKSIPSLQWIKFFFVVLIKWIFVGFHCFIFRTHYSLWLFKSLITASFTIGRYLLNYRPVPVILNPTTQTTHYSGHPKPRSTDTSLELTTGQAISVDIHKSLISTLQLQAVKCIYVMIVLPLCRQIIKKTSDITYVMILK